ncbi:MAG: toll/interleukin-1 receptor domain-containing protein [Ilumatobacter sp.]|uniref:toll/interleukin-1 receptor domain-containing protein n=1 Tax=Ilumatobacter sp. TaxID=1967498 RepID=UPI002605FCA9|nr:toll/interleukin-1 receptor domain-containing protein [Ilumatobacter sp.]MDJ0768052.1 toll/interleukin-1 receptor domain-containing protein [Ilumatobacter sp.]
MPDVFISYSRRDADFVDGLRRTLEQRDYETWVDETDIAPSVDWREEIHDGIATSEALIVVVSPDYAASEVCGEEVGRAEALGKRIVPVVCRDTEPASVLPVVAARNWIFARTDDEIAAAVGKIDEALSVDPDWAKEHTRLLGRALVWDQRNQDASILLRGSELDAAETAVAAERPIEQPQVTELQRRFVQASRTAATKRSRRLVLVSAAVAAVSIALAVVAVLQTFEANEQRDTAQARERLAESRSLAAQAMQLVEFEPETAALLAVEAMRLEATAEARDALLTALAANPAGLDELDIGEESDHNPTSFLDPSGRYEVSDEGSLITDTTTGDTQRMIELDPDETIVALRDTTFDPTGTRVVFHNLPAERYEVFDVSDGLPARELPSPSVEGFVLDAAFRADGRLVALWTTDDPDAAGDEDDEGDDELISDLRLTVFDDDARELFSARFNGRIPEGIDLRDSFVVMSGDEDLGAIVTIDGEAQLFSPSSARFIGPLLPSDCTPDCTEIEIIAGAAALASLGGDELAVTDHTSTRRTWTLDVDDWIDAACAAADRELTAQERERFLSDVSAGSSACAP